MKLFRSILISLALLLICSAGALADNIVKQNGTTALQSLPSTISSLTPISDDINPSEQQLSQLIKPTDTVYYYDTMLFPPKDGQESSATSYGQIGEGGAQYPLVVNPGTTWLILNNDLVYEDTDGTNSLGVNGAIQVANGATLNIIVCPTGGPGKGGVSLGTGISSVDLSSFNNSIGIENNGTINVIGTTSDPNTSYLAIGIGATYPAYNNLAWNIRESENGNSTSSFNVYSAYTEILYGGSSATEGQPSAGAFINNDNVTVANGGVLQTSSSQPTATTAVLSDNTNLTVNDGVVLGGSTGGSSLPLGLTNFTSSDNSLIAASRLTVPSSNVADSLIVNLGTYNVTKTGDTITGSTLSNSQATVVGNVTFGWGGQFENFNFSQSQTLAEGQATLTVPTNSTLTIPADSDVTLGENTVLSNNGTITVQSEE